MNTQFKKGIIELCILHVINIRDCYGYELVDILSKSVSVTGNTIYPILKRLTDRKMFTTYLLESSQGAPRKYYQMTDLGKRQLDAYQDDWNSFLKGVSKLLEKEAI